MTRPLIQSLRSPWTALVLLPPLLWLALVLWSDVNFPIMDEIDVPGALIHRDAMDASIEWSHFFYWHNESRKALPVFVLFCLYKLSGYWNLKLEMAVSIAWGVFNCLLVIALAGAWMRRAFGGHFRHAGLFGVVYSFYYFAPYSFFRWINGITLHRILPDTFLLLSLGVFLSPRLSPWSKGAAYALFSIGAQLSFSGGVVLWPITLFLIAAEYGPGLRVRGLRLAIYAPAFLLTQWAYFRDSTDLVARTASKTVDWAALELGRAGVYVFSFITTGIYRHGADHWAALLGASIVAGLAFTAFRFRRRLDPAVWTVLAALVLYPTSLAVLAGLGRDFEHPRQLRYVLYGAYLPLATALAVSIWVKLSSSRRALYLVGVPLAVLYAESYLDGHAFRQTHQHLSKVSQARTCLLSDPPLPQRRRCLATIYPADSGPAFEAADQRLRELVERGAIR